MLHRILLFSAKYQHESAIGIHMSHLKVFDTQNCIPMQKKVHIVRNVVKYSAFSQNTLNDKIHFIFTLARMSQWLLGHWFSDPSNLPFMVQMKLYPLSPVQMC